MTTRISRDELAQRIAADIHEGAYVNLGIGAPTLVANFLPDDLEIILHTERPVVGVEVVPVERVRLSVELVQGHETVSGQVRREQVVVDQDTLPPRDAV